MFSRRVFFPGAAPDAFQIVFEFGPGDLDPEREAKQVRLTVIAAMLTFEWNSSETESEVLERFSRELSGVLLERMEEKAIVVIKVESIPHAATFPAPKLKLHIRTAKVSPILRCINCARVSSSGFVSEATLTALLKHCELPTVFRIKSADGFGNFWATCTEIAQWQSLRNLNLSNSGLTVLPSVIGHLKKLKILRLSHNKLAALPAEMQKLRDLEVLAADFNSLVTVPGIQSLKSFITVLLNF